MFVILAVEQNEHWMVYQEKANNKEAFAMYILFFEKFVSKEGYIACTEGNVTSVVVNHVISWFTQEIHFPNQ